MDNLLRKGVKTRGLDTVFRGGYEGGGGRSGPHDHHSVFKQLCDALATDRAFNIMNVA